MELEKEIQQKYFKSEAHKVGVNIIYTFNWLASFHSEHLKKHCLTSQQFNVLRILRGQHPNFATVKMIRERMLDKMSDASRIVEKLRLKNLVDRQIDPADRRACNVMITKKGLDLLQKIDEDDVNFENHFASLSNDEMKQLNHLLDKLRG